MKGNVSVVRVGGGINIYIYETELNRKKRKIKIYVKENYIYSGTL